VLVYYRVITLGSAGLVLRLISFDLWLVGFVQASQEVIEVRAKAVGFLCNITVPRLLARGRQDLFDRCEFDHPQKLRIYS